MKPAATTHGGRRTRALGLNAVGIVALGFVAVACGASETSAPSEAATPPPITPHGPTYYQDVLPIFAGRCAQCHTAGGIAPFAIDDPESAKVYAGAIKLETGARTMPPWPPGPESMAMRHERKLTDEQIALIAAWADAGAPLGDPARAAAPLAHDVVDIGIPELRVDTGVDYLPDTGAKDEYRCFLVDMKMAEARTATGFRITPGNAKTVHHVITTVYDASSRAALEQLDAESPERAGWSCIGGPIPQSFDGKIESIGTLGSWVPGVSAVALPKGTGTPLPAGALAVMQVHYNVHGPPAADRTTLEVAFAPKGTEATLERLVNVRLAEPQLSIPPEAVTPFEQSAPARLWMKGKFFEGGTGYLLGASGHMHLLGKQITLEVTNDAGTRKVLDIPAWDFHWQGGYELATPVAIQATDRLTIRCTYDNTTAHRTKVGYPEDPHVVTWGEGTADEMCLGSFQIVGKLPQ